MDASQAGEGHEEYSFASDSLWNEARAVLTALISAFRYGLKIRLPHALVMTFMFRRDLSTQGKLRVILRAVAEHATSLGSFAFIYKVTLFFLKYLHRRYGNLMIDTLKDPTRSHSLGRILMSMIVPNNHSAPSPEYGVRSAPPGRPEQSFHALIAGAVGGYLVWGRYSAISHQVLFYVSIRVLAGLWKCLPLHDDAQWRTLHRVVSTLAWSLVMYLWESSPDSLQQSLRKSMDEIYDPEYFALKGYGRRKEQ